MRRLDERRRAITGALAPVLGLLAVTLACGGLLGQQPDELAPDGVGGALMYSSERRTAEAIALPHHKKLIARTWNLCRFERDLDYQDQGIIIASDGLCYFASSTHSRRHGAVAFSYDPAREALKRLCDDISTVCGEDPRLAIPQGMMLTAPVELDGTIYWGTHSANHGAANAPLYAGGHVVGYDTGKGEWRDLGVLRPNFTIFSGLAADAAGKRLYVTVSPPVGREGEASWLYRIDLPDGKPRAAGLIAYGGMIGYPGIWADVGGRCWLTAPGGNMLCYDPGRDVMTGWLDALPPARSPEGYPDFDTTTQVRRMWQWVSALPKKNQCLFTLRASAGFYFFSPGRIGRRPEDPFAILGQVTGHTGLAVAVAGDRIYFVQEMAVAPALDVALLHLRSVDYTDPQARVMDHGAIVDAEGRLPLRIAALAADAIGRVYLVGDWRTTVTDPTTLLYRGGESYLPVARAQFFAATEAPFER